MALDLASAQAALTAWQAADLAVATSQSYSFAGRTLTRADSAEIRTNIQYWDGQVAMLSARSRGIRQPRVTLVRYEA